MLKLKDIFFIIIHILVATIIAIYSFIIKDTKYDNVYIYLIYLKLFHWTLLNGECIISYIYKKSENINYIAGEKLYDNEFDNKFKNYKCMIRLFIIIINILTIISIYNVFNRNNYSNDLIILFIIMYVAYLYSLCLFTDHNKNKNFLKFQSIIQLFLILWILYFYYKKLKDNQ
jgi:hypothetical protein